MRIWKPSDNPAAFLLLECIRYNMRMRVTIGLRLQNAADILVDGEIEGYVTRDVGGWVWMSNEKWRSMKFRRIEEVCEWLEEYLDGIEMQDQI